MNTNEQQHVDREFHDAVNMSSNELESWLDTDTSKAAGWKPDGANQSGTSRTGALTNARFNGPCDHLGQHHGAFFGWQ